MLRKMIALLSLVSLFYWTPSVAPVIHLKPQTEANAFSSPSPCLVQNTYQSWDTAFADCILAPPSSGHTAAPWAAITVIAGVASILLDAIIVWNTQCRELTLDEVVVAGSLPAVGIAINQVRSQHSACKTH